MISSIGLEAFKAFASLVLPLGKLTLLTGVNGAGKSSIIQAILALRQSHEQMQLEQSRLVFNGELVQLGRTQDVLHDDATVDRDRLQIALNWDDGQRAVWRFQYEIDRTSLVGGYEGVLVPWSRTPFTPEFQYLAAERIGPRAWYSTNDDEVWNRGGLGIRGEYAAQFISLFGTRSVEIESARRSSAASDSLRDQVEAWLDVVSPGTRLHTTAHPGVDAVQLAYSFQRTTGSTNQYRPTNVGFGLTYTLPVLVALLAARPGGLVIIENPEAHLHPKGQVALGELLTLVANAGVQLIVETHSDHVLNGVRVAVAKNLIPSQDVRIHFFARTRDSRHSVASPVLNSSGRIDHWPEDFFDQWNKSLETLLLLREDDE